MSDANDYSDEDPVVSTSENRLGLCEVCGECLAKYTCPRCETKSCSLECVKIHKEDLDCSGERDKTAYKSLSQFTNLDLLSDYRLLEETTRSVENYKRDPLKHFTRWNRRLAVHLSRLKEAVSHRGANLLFLPPHFVRHKSNTTYFDWKTQKISWRIEWIFPQSNFIKAIDERALEDTRVCTLINKYLDNKTCPEELQDSLQFYQSSGISELSLLLKAEHVKKSSAKFYEIDPAQTLKCALKEKTIIEFPSIYVVHKTNKEMFDIVCSDDEEREENEEMHSANMKARGNFHNFHPRYQNTGRNLKRKKQKNFLFHDPDSSDNSLSDDCSSSKQSSKVHENNESSFNIPTYHELIKQDQ